MNLKTLGYAAALACSYSLCAFGSNSSTGTDSVCQLDVGAQSLDESLQAIAKQCGVQIIYFSEITSGVAAPRLNGPSSVDDVLHQLLDDAGLSFRHINAETIEIRRGPPRDKRRSAHRMPDKDPELQEVIIAGTAVGLVATRVETPLRDIPQSITIIGAEQIRQQNNFTLNEVLDDGIGITAVRSTSLFQTFYSRGFEITSYTLDHGGALRQFTEYLSGTTLLTPDLSEFDHIEVLRGADALFGADGPPGGAIDMVRKRPLHTPSAKLTSSVGSWNNYRQEVDVTGPIAQDGGLRGRLDVSYTHRDYFYDYAHDERKSIFGVLDDDLTDSTTITAGGSYSASRARPVALGLPRLNTGADAHLPRSTAYGFDWAHFETQVRETYVQLDHALDSHWHLKASATLLNESANYAYARFITSIDAATGGEAIPPFASFTSGPTTQKQFNVETTLTGATEWAGHAADIAVGADFVRSHANLLNGESPLFGPPLENAYDFDPSEYPDPTHDPDAGPVFGQDTTTILSGVYGSMRMQLTKPWSVTAGLRVSKQRVTDDSTYYYPGFSFSLPASYEYNGKVTPYLGSVYTFNDTYAVYASYANIYMSNGGVVSSEQRRLPPVDGIDMEAGIKGTWRGGDVNGSLAAYKILQKGIALYDINAVPETSDCCYLSSGRNISEGVELELTGKLAMGWLLGAGYTVSQSEQVVAGDARISPASGITPRHLLRLWTQYSFPGEWSHWNIGTTLHAQSAIHRDDRYCPHLTASFFCVGGYQVSRTIQKSYAVVSPRIGYDFDRRWQLALTLNNALDKRYYQTVGSPNGGSWYGEPRNFLLRLDVRF